MKSLLLLSLFFAQTGTPHPPNLNGFWNNQYTPNLAQELGHLLEDKILDGAAARVSLDTRRATG